jgi:hypothetical protein
MSAGDTETTESLPELSALTAVVRALQALTPENRQRVVDSALTLLGAKPITSSKLSIIEKQADGSTASAVAAASDIRSLKEQKKPQSANEMAAIVAYYLAEFVGDAQRRQAVDIADIEKYFKQANYRLPAHPKMTLVNAKNAGYFDAVGSGSYKLNPVGYNLVVHSLPRGASTERVQTSRGKRRRPAAKRVLNTKRKKPARS